MSPATVIVQIDLNCCRDDSIRKLKRNMDVVRRFLCRMCIFLVVLVISGTEAFNVDFDFLPSDESDAIVYLKEGVLDSSLWEALLPFYRKPLSVPAGELSYLKPLFPDDEESFPVAQSILAAYQPWDVTAIDRFFHDYPLLTFFRPLLVFDYHKKHTVGEMAIHLNGRGSGTSVAHNARFSVSSTRNLILQGTADITSASARWERRLLTLTPVSGVSVQCGNAPLFSEKGLVYGYFPETFVNESHVNDNWLYGDAATWNGISAGYTRNSKGRVPALSFSGFFHKRPTEMITGSTLSARRKRMKMSLAVSCAEYTDQHGDDIFVHGSFRKRWEGVFTEINTALTTGKAIKLSFLWQTGCTIGAGKAGISLMHMPAGINASRSSMLRRCLSELDYDDTLFSAASMLRFNVRTPSIGVLRLRPRIDIWFRGTDADHGKAVLSGDVKWEKFNGHFQMIHIVSDDNEEYGEGSISWRAGMRVTGNIQAGVRSRFFFDEYHISSFSGSFQPVFTLYSRFDIEPMFSYQRLKAGNDRYVFGMRQRLTLFDRTTTSFSFKKILTSNDIEDDLQIDARAVLFF